MGKGVDDLDFYIGDEAVDKPLYSTKVREPGGSARPRRAEQTFNVFQMLSSSMLLEIRKREAE